MVLFPFDKNGEEFGEIGKDTHRFIDVRGKLDRTTLAAAFFTGRSMQDRPEYQCVSPVWAGQLRKRCNYCGAVMDNAQL